MPLEIRTACGKSSHNGLVGGYDRDRRCSHIFRTAVDPLHAFRGATGTLAVEHFRVCTNTFMSQNALASLRFKQGFVEDEPSIRLMQASPEVMGEESKGAVSFHEPAMYPVSGCTLVMAVYRSLFFPIGR